jgi:hypothetical protein
MQPEPHEMLTAKEMAKLMRISQREFRRRVGKGEVPGGRPYMGGRVRWPAFVGYYLVYSELLAAWQAAPGVTPDPENSRAQKRQSGPNAAK